MRRTVPSPKDHHITPVEDGGVIITRTGFRTGGAHRRPHIRTICVAFQATTQVVIGTANTAIAVAIARSTPRRLTLCAATFGSSAYTTAARMPRGAGPAVCNLRVAFQATTQVVIGTANTAIAVAIARSTPRRLTLCAATFGSSAYITAARMPRGAGRAVGL